MSLCISDWLGSCETIGVYCGTSGQPHACPCHQELTEKMVPMSGNHRDCLPFLLIPSPQILVVLASTHSTHANNPHRDWALGKVLSWSTHCLMLQSVYATADSSLPKPSNVPTEYMDLYEVFSKSRGLSLPTHHLFDCAIYLLPGATLPSSCLYSLSGCSWFSPIVDLITTDVANHEPLAIRLALKERRYWLKGKEQPFIVWMNNRNVLTSRESRFWTTVNPSGLCFLVHTTFTLTYRHNVRLEALSA